MAQSPREDPYGMQVLDLISENGTDIDFITVTGSFQSIEDNGCSEYDFTFKSTLSFKTREQFAMSIYEMLDNDFPVITRIGTENVPMFKTANDMGNFNWHYIVITEMEYDLKNNKYRLTCSSWGQKYYIDLDDLYDHSGLTGGFVNASK